MVEQYNYECYGLNEFVVKKDDKVLFVIDNEFKAREIVDILNNKNTIRYDSDDPHFNCTPDVKMYIKRALSQIVRSYFDDLDEGDIFIPVTGVRCFEVNIHNNVKYRISLGVKQC